MLFRSQKLVYGGPSLLTMGADYSFRINSSTYFKYSVLPLIPSLIKNTNLEKLNNNMIENKVGFSLFQSANKVGALKQKDNKFHSFYDSNGNYNPFSKNSNFNIIDIGYMGIQVDVAPYTKEYVIMATQENKLITSGLYENDGKFKNLSIPVYGENGVTIVSSKSNELKTVSGKDVQKVYNKLDKDILIKNYNNLLDEIGLSKTSDGNYYFSKGFELKRILLEQAKNRNSSDNIINAIESIVDSSSGVIKNGIDSFPNKSKLEQIIFALVRNKVIRKKAQGGPKIQVASTGFEKNIRKIDGTKGVYSSNEFKFYRKGLFKETLPMQVAVALPKNMINFVLSRYGKQGGNIEDALDNFNNALSEFFKDDLNRYDTLKVNELGIDLNILRLIGYRIPTQSLNSIESMEIVRFLPPSSGETIVVPSGIVGKSGSDFDIDKLNTFMPYYINYKGNLKYIKNNNDIEDYISKLEEDLQGLRKEFNLNVSEEDKNLDITVLKEEINKAKKLLKESPVEKNQMYSLSRSILSSPENFIQLLTPNTSDTLKNLAKKIQKAYDIDNERPMKDLISWSYNNTVATNNWVGKEGVGITALHTTTHRLFQEVNASVSKQPQYKLNFEGMEDEFSMAREYSFDKSDTIANIISEFLTSYVDIAKEPFILDLNASTQLSNTY